MSTEIFNRAGDSITTEDETLLLDSIHRWLDRDVKDKVMAL